MTSLWRKVMSFMMASVSNAIVCKEQDNCLLLVHTDKVPLFKAFIPSSERPDI